MHRPRSPRPPWRRLRRAPRTRASTRSRRRSSAARGRQPPARLDTTKRDSADALASLRARARAAAGTDTATAPAQGRERNLNQLNPEISAAADVRAYVQTEGPQRDNFALEEVEFAFQSALDPYSNTKIFAGVSDEGIDIEEAYFYYTGLPGRLRLDVGRFRQQLGELNRWHLHGARDRSSARPHDVHRT
jgi:hypothetical protein